MSICAETIHEAFGSRHSFPSLLKAHEKFGESEASVETSSRGFLVHPQAVISASSLITIMTFSPKLKY